MFIDLSSLSPTAGHFRVRSGSTCQPCAQERVFISLLKRWDMRVRTAGQGNASLWVLPDVQGKGPVRQKEVLLLS
jgi:hypothetical protein